MSTKKLKKGTKTSSFGVGKREQHDSSVFYNSKLYENKVINEKIEEIQNVIVPKYLECLICADSTNMDSPHF